MSTRKPKHFPSEDKVTEWASLNMMEMVSYSGANGISFKSRLSQSCHLAFRLPDGTWILEPKTGAK